MLNFIIFKKSVYKVSFFHCRGEPALMTVVYTVSVSELLPTPPKVSHTTWAQLPSIDLVGQSLGPVNRCLQLQVEPGLFYRIWGNLYHFLIQSYCFRFHLQILHTVITWLIKTPPNGHWDSDAQANEGSFCFRAFESLTVHFECILIWSLCFHFIFLLLFSKWHLSDGNWEINPDLNSCWNYWYFPECSWPWRMQRFSDYSPVYSPRKPAVKQCW